MVIDMYSSEETQQYLARAKDIYIDPNVKPTYKDTSEHPVTYEQRVLVRYLATTSSSTTRSNETNYL